MDAILEYLGLISATTIGFVLAQAGVIGFTVWRAKKRMAAEVARRSEKYLEFAQMMGEGLGENPLKLKPVEDTSDHRPGLAVDVAKRPGEEYETREGLDNTGALA